MNEIKGVVTHKPIKRKRNHKALIFVSVGLLILAIIAASYYYYSNRTKSSSSVCTVSQLEEAGTKINANQTSQLVGVVRDIQATPGYDSDASCLYVVTQYYIGITNGEEARKYYDLLLKAYDPEVGYSPSLGEETASPDKMAGPVVFVEKLTKEAPSASLEKQTIGQ